MDLFDFSWERPEEEWRPVSTAALIAWLVFYALFLLHAATDRDGFLIIDNVNLIVHEGGHFFFSWLGETMSILGGTLAELLVPLLLAAYFFWHRHTSGLAFALFFFFENFLYVGWYMADARIQSLPLAGSGDHDWQILFTQWGVLNKDHIIGGFMRRAGWVGMLAAVGWLVWMFRRAAVERARSAVI